MAAAGPRARRPFFFCIWFVGAGDRVTRPETETRGGLCLHPFLEINLFLETDEGIIHP